MSTIAVLVALCLPAFALAKAPVIISGDITLTTPGASGGNRLVVKLLERTSSGASLDLAWTVVPIGENALPPYHYSITVPDSAYLSHPGSTYAIQASIAIQTSIRFQDSKTYTLGTTTVSFALHPSTGYLPYTAGPGPDTPTPELPTLEPPSPVPSATPSPVAVTTPDIDALFDAELKKYTEGKIKYNPPAEMTVDESVVVEAYITRGTDQNLPTPIFRGPGAPITATLPLVSSLMNVTLSGGEGKFKISDNVHEQSVNKDSYTRWWWDVVPMATGVYTLSITVKAKIEIQGSPPREKIIDVKDAKIRVKVNPAYSVKQFFQMNWQWLATALIIPLGVFGWNNWRKRKELQSPVMSTQLHDPNAMLSTREIAEQLNISTTDVRDLILSGTLPTFRIANQLRIKQRDIDLYLERQQAGSKSRSS